MSRHRRPKRRTWIFPALFALIVFLGNVAIQVLSAELSRWLMPYRFWLWAVFGLALIATIVLAVQEYRGAAEPPPLDLPGVVSKFETLRKTYLKRVMEGAQYLPLAAVDFQAADASTTEQKRMHLPDVYINLNTTDRIRLEKEELGKKGRGREDDTRPLPVLEALVRDKRMVLLGDPGSGKTTFVNYLTFCLAAGTLDSRSDWVEHLEGWPQTWDTLLPVPIVLRELAVWLESSDCEARKTGLLEAYLRYWLQTGVEDFYEPLLQMLRQGKAVLLLDGLDEVPGDAAICRRIREMLDDLPLVYESPMVVTCRVLSYQDPRWRLDASKWPRHELDKLNEEQVDGFISAWYAQLESMKAIGSAKRRAGKLQRAVRQKDLWRLAQNPLLLTVMALVHTRKGDLPEARALLYEDAVELLLWRWEAGKTQTREGEETNWRLLLQQAELEDVDVQLALWELAFHAHAQVRDAEDSEATADIAQATLENALRTLAPDGSQTWIDAMIQLINLRAGLLVADRPGIYRFPHRTFQEYLAGCYLSGQEDFIDRAEALAEEGAFWRVVILLAVGRLVHVNKNIDKPLILVRELCPPQAPDFDDDVAWRKIWLAGACLREVGLKRSQRRELGKELIPRLQSHLTTLITHDLLKPRERAEAGSVLSVLGDPRDFEDMLPVPAGEFTMGSKEDDPTAFDNEKPQHPQYVESFRIGKYPVTNSQYAHFIAVSGHPAPPHWRGQEPPPELRNHPVVNVRWHDAVAYCQFLSQEKGEEYRLPTETEWEKAARGDKDARLYPWEGDFHPDKCNMRETGIGGTSPVGIFAVDTSPYGCLDMSGNVWEWTLSLWGTGWDKQEYGYPYNSADGRENFEASDRVLRVVRGGSFRNSQQDARCAFRNRLNPYYWFDYYGFRVVAPGL